ncbi:hypothetical protein JTB14_022009 [Gonioctena quinquepunctata]|nr:hypothetical protein JTB14_022009 [Gonioctena quinquepunctata]
MTNNAEKIKVRELKNECKTRATIDKKFVCGSFDLQQVLHLPVSNESAIFYKRRLSNYNLTYYDIVTKACKCFIWHEGISKRESCEIATCIYRVLQSYDNNNVQFVSLYSDGCGGQNKNSIVAAMLLFAVVQSRNIESITLRYFESYHGQNEGDSVHSCISNAVSHAGDLFVTAQLHTIFKLARRQRPYDVFPLGFEDFIDFKKLSLDLRILKSRETDDAIKWNDIMEVKVSKLHPDTLFFKSSHNQQEYSKITLKRQKKINLKTVILRPLNEEPNKIGKAKYKDLMSLCQGVTPVVKIAEYKDFYASLPHTDN